MSATKSHGEKIMFVVVLLLCLAFIGYNSFQGEPPIFGDLGRYLQTITSTLSKNEATPKYAYATEETKKLDTIQARWNRNFDRGANISIQIPPRVVYPKPSRPLVDLETKPGEIPVVHEVASLGQLLEVKARGDHGRVFITFRLPQDMKLMDPLRVEIFRGEAADKVDISRPPYEVIEYAPEDISAVLLDETSTTPPAVRERTTPETPGTMSSGERASREGRDAPPVREPAGDKDKKPIDLPPDCVGLRLYPDTHVDAKKAYFYQLRLVGRMHFPPGFVKEEKDAAGKVLKKIVYDPPKDATNIHPKKGDSKQLFASAFSKVVDATPPADFELRLSAIDETGGKVPPSGTPDWQLRDFTGYKGIFAVRVWVKDAQEWYEKFVQAGQDEKLKGSLTFKSADNPRERKNYDFDTGYVLVEIKEVEVVREVTKTVPKLDANGNPITDKDGPVMEEKKEQQRSTNQVAILKDTNTGKLEEFPKSMDYPRRDKYLEDIRKMAARNSALLKAEQDRIKAELRKREAERKAREQPVQPLPGIPGPGTEPGLRPDRGGGA